MYFSHLLCGLVFVGRAGDVGSTYLVTPTLKLEANPLVRKLRWPLAVVSLLFCLVPYVDLGAGVAVAVMSLAVTGSNLRLLWVARALGEEGLLEFYVGAAKRSSLRSMLLAHSASCCFDASVGLVLFFFEHDPRRWAFWVAAGIVIFAFARLVHGASFLRRLHRIARESNG